MRPLTVNIALIKWLNERKRLKAAAGHHDKTTAMLTLTATTTATMTLTSTTVTIITHPATNSYNKYDTVYRSKEQEQEQHQLDV